MTTRKTDAVDTEPGREVPDAPGGMVSNVLADGTIIPRRSQAQTLIGVENDPEAVLVYANCDIQWNLDKDWYIDKSRVLDVRFWLDDGDGPFCLDGVDEAGRPLCEVTQSLLEGYLPIVRTQVRCKGLELEILTFTALLTSTEGNFFWGKLAPVFCLVKAKNHSDDLFGGAFGAGFATPEYLPPTFMTADGGLYTFGLAPTPYRSFQQIRYTMSSSPMPHTPGNIQLSAIKARERSSLPPVVFEKGLGIEGLVHQLELDPGEEFSCTLIFNRLQGYLGDVHKGLTAIDVPKVFETTVDEWRSLLNKGVEITVGDTELADVCKASTMYLLLSRVAGTFQAGRTAHTGFWIRDGVYCMHALDLMGLHEEAEIAVNNMLTQQCADGLIVQENYSNTEWDCQGEALWGVFQHYELTGDTEWLRSVFPQIRKAVGWISRARQTTKGDPEACHYGLLPESLGEGLTNKYGYHYYDDIFGVLGMACAVKAAEALGIQPDLESFRAEYTDFKECLFRSIDRACERDGVDHIPGGPNFTKVRSYMERNLTLMLYPGKLMDPHDPMVTSSLKKIKSKLFCKGLVYHHWPAYRERYHWTVLTFEFGWTHLLRGEREEAIETMETMVRCATPTWSWPEGFGDDGNCGGDMPIPWGQANCVILLRQLLLLEDEAAQTIAITPAVRTQWLQGGKPIKLARCPTLYGRVSFSLTMDPAGKRLSLEVQAEKPDRFKGFSLPLPVGLDGTIAEVKVDGKDWQQHDETSVAFPSNTRTVEVRWA